MATRIKFKRSETIGSVPDSSDLEIGEVALNIVDQKFYVRATDLPPPQPDDLPIPQIIELANKGQTATEVTSTCTMMSIALG